MTALLLLAIALFLSSLADASNWAVVPFTRSFEVDLDADLVSIDVPFAAESGAMRYRFWCRGGSDLMLDKMSERDGINYVGPLMCVLNEGDEMREASLLAEDDAAPWHTRGMFRKEDLVCACGTYPEFGLDRDFRLRGYILGLKVRNLQLRADGTVHGFTLNVSVESDRDATSPVAERPGYLAPTSGDCSVVRRGTEPRMCRNRDNGGSYELCSNQ